jgi:hypothetical protein
MIEQLTRLFSRLFEVSQTKWTWRWYVLRTKWFGIKIHWIRPEVDEWHTHPWNGFSIIFGSYQEQLKPDGPWYTRRFVNRVGVKRKHRTKGNCLTIFIHGPRVNDGWYWGEENAPWRGPQRQVSK